MPQNTIPDHVTGSYTKIGRLVKVTGVVQNNESGSRSGRFEVTQLPFTAASVSQLACGSFWMDRGSGNDTVGGGIYLIGNTTKFRFVNPSAVHTNQGGDDAARTTCGLMMPLARALTLRNAQAGREVVTEVA